MTTDLPAIVAELRALFIVALMKQGETREDAELRATPDISYERTKVDCGDKHGVTHCWYIMPLSSLNVDKPLYEKHARAILEAHYGALWCGLQKQYGIYSYSDEHSAVSGSGRTRDNKKRSKLSAILSAMQALYAEGQP